MQEALFVDMSVESWRACLAPKVQGTWNLHDALAGIPHDFFLMTSSIAGSVGTATEGNYCAANAFQDAFARFRRARDLPAVAVGLGMVSQVGYLAEHPEIEALLRRRGLHALDEADFLRIVDLAVSRPDATDYASYAPRQFLTAHLLTGLEAHGLNAQRGRGFEGGSHVLDDPRALLMARTLSGAAHTSGETAAAAAAGSSSAGEAGASADGSETGLLAAVDVALAALLRRPTEEEDGHGDDDDDDDNKNNNKNNNNNNNNNNNDDDDEDGNEQQEERRTRLAEAVQAVVARKLSNLLLLRAEQLDGQARLAGFGLDSMLAAELRQYFYRALGVDVTFLALLDRKATAAGLAGMIVQALLAREKKSGSGSGSGSEGVKL